MKRYVIGELRNTTTFDDFPSRLACHDVKPFRCLTKKSSGFLVFPKFFFQFLLLVQSYPQFPQSALLNLMHPLP
jgi:hypothetical protein